MRCGERLTFTMAVVLAVTACGKTGHLAEVTYKPGVSVSGMHGRGVAELPTAVQQRLRADMVQCETAATITVPDDRLALIALAGAASGALAAHGGAARFQGGINGATNAMDQAPSSALTDEIKEAAEWRASDCLKNKGWDATPYFMAQH